MENEGKKEESTQNTSGGGSGKIIGIIAIVIILAIAGFVYEKHAKQNMAATSMAPQKKMSALPQSSGSAMTTALYKDGTYSAEGDYITHVGQKHIKVTITLKNDIITSADVINEADDRMSQHFQDSFISGYKPLVIGKDITKVHLGKVAMSSLTPNGFNAALQTIEQQAKS